MIDSVTVTATQTEQGTIEVNKQHVAAEFVLTLSNAATDVDDTLDVFIQAYVGGQWIDVVHFGQILGNGADSIVSVAKIVASEPQAQFLTSSALAASAVRHLLSSKYRARWDVVDSNGAGGAADGDVSFTFSIKTNFIGYVE